MEAPKEIRDAFEEVGKRVIACADASSGLVWSGVKDLM
jgi:hypothetical protein